MYPMVSYLVFRYIVVAAQALGKTMIIEYLALPDDSDVQQDLPKEAKALER